MKLLVSPADSIEAVSAVEGGADIIDIKNPREGSLGASFPWVINEITDAVPEGIEISATIGDLSYKPGHASLAAHGLSTLGVGYIKAGFCVEKKEEADALAGAIIKAVDDSGIKVVLASYADHNVIGSISPLDLLDVARTSGAHGVMIDTYKKNGATLFDNLPLPELNRFVEQGRDCGLLLALAGSIKIEHVPLLKELGPDIVGVRGVVCTDNDRLGGKIEKEKVKDFKKQLLS